MSGSPPQADPTGDSNWTEPLKLWSCVNCRRRKVRCDRRRPCAPCIRNKTECIFPVSGRVPRRSRDVYDSKVQAEKQALLLGRLRRLEAMVGDLGSQVENAAALTQSNHPPGSAVNVQNESSSKKGGPDQQPAPHNQSEDRHTPIDRMDANYSTVNGTSGPSQTSDELGDLEVASNGDLVVCNRFWTVFCKEVCTQLFPISRALELGNLSLGHVKG